MAGRVWLAQLPSLPLELACFQSASQLIWCLALLRPNTSVLSSSGIVLRMGSLCRDAFSRSVRMHFLVVMPLYGESVLLCNRTVWSPVSERSSILIFTHLPRRHPPFVVHSSMWHPETRAKQLIELNPTLQCSRMELYYYKGCNLENRLIPL